MEESDLFMGYNVESSRRKTSNKPTNGSVSIKSGKGQIQKDNLGKSSVKVREKDSSRSMSPRLKNRGKPEAESATVEEKNAAKLESVHKFVKDSRSTIESSKGFCASAFQNDIQHKAASSPSLELLFSNKARDRKLQYFMPKILNGTKTVRIPEAVIAEGIKQWELCLVGQLLGKCSGVSLVLNKANELWGEEGKIQVTKTNNELYIFKFPNENTRDRAFEYGPWYIENKPLVLRMWQPDTKLSLLDNSKVAVWVKLIGIPMEYLTRQGVSYIASALGKPLYIATTYTFCFDFVKVCVEVSMEDDMMDFITVVGCDGEKVRVKVEYLWKPDKCFTCKEFGHSSSKCPKFKLLTGKAD